ncbi:MAG: hypothetical protein ACLT98_16670 [Eggerthellaceae bacterium]
MQQAIERDRAATVATCAWHRHPWRATHADPGRVAVVACNGHGSLAWGQIDVASHVFVAVLP